MKFIRKSRYRRNNFMSLVSVEFIFVEYIFVESTTAGLNYSLLDRYWEKKNL